MLWVIFYKTYTMKKVPLMTCKQCKLLHNRDIFLRVFCRPAKYQVNDCLTKFAKVRKGYFTIIAPLDYQYQVKQRGFIKSLRVKLPFFLKTRLYIPAEKTIAKKTKRVAEKPKICRQKNEGRKYAVGMPTSLAWLAKRGQAQAWLGLFDKMSLQAACTLACETIFLHKVKD